jgi:hypothetical protein
MTMSNRPHRLATASLLLALAAPVASAQGPAGRPGVIWESTSTMEASGMAMPPQTIRHCAPEGDWKEPPSTQPPDSKCKMTDLKQSGKTTSWKMVCEGKEKASGQGTVTRDGDTYRGTMSFTTSHGTMDVKTSGRKIGGACEVGKPLPGDNRQAEIKAMIDQSKRDTATGMEKECKKAVKEMQPSLFLLQGTYSCRGTPQQEEFCKRFQTDEGFRKAGRSGDDLVGKSAELCKVDLAALRARFCSEAVKARDLAYIGGSCPAERAALAKKECAGKEDSNLAPAIRDFCLRHGKELLLQDPKAKKKKSPSAETAPEPGPTDDAVDQGKKALKGVLGF